jgi:hypothetical protein
MDNRRGTQKRGNQPGIAKLQSTRKLNVPAKADLVRLVGIPAFAFAERMPCESVAATKDEWSAKTLLEFRLVGLL